MCALAILLEDAGNIALRSSKIHFQCSAPASDDFQSAVPLQCYIVACVQHVKELVMCLLILSYCHGRVCQQHSTLKFFVKILTVLLQHKHTHMAIAVLDMKLWFARKALQIAIQS